MNEIFKNIDKDYDKLKKDIDIFFDKVNAHYQAPSLAYTDVIAIDIKDALKKYPENKVGGINWDLDPNDGSYVSSKKTIPLEYGGKKYKITITEL